MGRQQRVLRVVVPGVLLLASAALLFLRLGLPGEIVFDETYYVDDARNFLQQGVEDGFAVHPPVGKWLIAAGIGLLGDDPVGWRTPGALVGAVSVLLVYLIGMRLFRRIGPAALAALLLATDGMWFVQARTGMLDIFLAFFVVLGAWLLLVDHDRNLAPRGDPLPGQAGVTGGRWPVPAGGSSDVPADRAATATLDVPARRPVRVRGQRRWRLPRRGHAVRAVAGVAFGLAVATKWSGVLALVAAVVLSVGWELARRRRVTGRWLTDAGRSAGSIALGLVLVPVATYALTFVPWLANYERTHTGAAECEVDGAVQDPCGVGLPARLAGLYRYHAEVARFHLDLEVEHPYRAPAYTWPIMARPIVYYYESCSAERAAGVRTTNDEGELEEPPPCVVPQGIAAEIVGLGNPALWYAFLPASALLAAGLAGRDRSAWFVTAFWAGQFLPWLVVVRPAFFFYTVPFIPFLALGVAYAVNWLYVRRPVRWLLAGIAVGAAAGFGSGYVAESLSNQAVDVARWLGLWTGGLIGAAAGAALTQARAPGARAGERDGASAGRPVGRWVAAVLAVLAVAAFLYFVPVWAAIALPESLVRQRWWFRGWI